jgi:hypothetical protein
MGDQFRAAGFDEVAGFGDQALKNIENLTHASFLINQFGN